MIQHRQVFDMYMCTYVNLPINTSYRQVVEGKHACHPGNTLLSFTMFVADCNRPISFIFPSIHLFTDPVVTVKVLICELKRIPIKLYSPIIELLLPGLNLLVVEAGGYKLGLFCKCSSISFCAMDKSYICCLRLAASNSNQRFNFFSPLFHFILDKVFDEIPNGLPSASCLL